MKENDRKCGRNERKLEKIPEKIKAGNLSGVVADFERAMDLLEKIVEQKEKNQENKWGERNDRNRRNYRRI